MILLMLALALGADADQAAHLDLTRQPSVAVLAELIGLKILNPHPSRSAWEFRNDNEDESFLLQTTIVNSNK